MQDLSVTLLPALLGLRVVLEQILDFCSTQQHL